MHDGAGRGLAGRRHRGVRQEGHLGHLSRACQRQYRDNSGVAYPLATAGPARLHAVAALDDIRLERDGARAAVQLQEEAAGIAENRAILIAAPERGSAGRAVLADRLMVVSTSTMERR
jgi:hypothetical protein